jgi:predicted lysophospholipase L1 biosynthesis ABC-type transport system permease subunit
LKQVVAKSIARPRFNTVLLAIFAGVALVLASVGLYGVMNYSATQRTHEVGIRMALGATRADIMRLVVGNGMLLTLIGIAIGVVASVGLTRVMQSFLFGVGATDAVTFIAVSALLIVVALIANYIPARKATRVNPVIALALRVDQSGERVFFPFSKTEIASGRPFTKSTRVRPSGVCRMTPGIDNAVRYQPRGNTTEFRGRPRLRSNTSSSPASR